MKCIIIIKMHFTITIVSLVFRCEVLAELKYAAHGIIEGPVERVMLYTCSTLSNLYIYIP